MDISVPKFESSNPFWSHLSARRHRLGPVGGLPGLEVHLGEVGRVSPILLFRHLAQKVFRSIRFDQPLISDFEEASHRLKSLK